VSELAGGCLFRTLWCQAASFGGLRGPRTVKSSASAAAASAALRRPATTTPSSQYSATRTSMAMVSSEHWLLLGARRRCLPAAGRRCFTPRIPSMACLTSAAGRVVLAVDERRRIGSHARPQQQEDTGQAPGGWMHGDKLKQIAEIIQRRTRKPATGPVLAGSRTTQQRSGTVCAIAMLGSSSSSTAHAIATAQA
jgi:hypothetical protein